MRLRFDVVCSIPRGKSDVYLKSSVAFPISPRATIETTGLTLPQRDDKRARIGCSVPNLVYIHR